MGFPEGRFFSPIARFLVTWSDGSSDTVLFEYLSSGAHRDVYVASVTTCLGATRLATKVEKRNKGYINDEFLGYSYYYTNCSFENNIKH